MPMPSTLTAPFPATDLEMPTHENKKALLDGGLFLTRGNISALPQAESVVLR